MKQIMTLCISRILRIVGVISVLCVSSFLLLPDAAAGIFGTVRGIVHDAQHRPIENARVVVHARAADWQKEAITDAEGRFQMDAVPAGEYTIRITRDAFRDFEGALNVSADAAPLLHFPLEVAGRTERVEVSGIANQVDASSSTTQETLSRQTIEETPGAARTNSLDFITDYTPGAYMVHDQLHVRGGHQVSWLVDGVPVPNTNIASNVGPQFDPKDIDIVEVQRGGYSAEYGDRTYGVFNVIPRSGFERNRDAEIVATYGGHHSTDSQISFGDHTNRFAYYASLSGTRTDIGLMPPEAGALHDNNNGESGFASLIFNATPKNQLRLVTSARADSFQIANTLDQQTAGVRDVQRERDAFVNFSWVHTTGPGLLFTLAPFYHWNRAAYDGHAPNPGLAPDSAPITTDHNDSRYAGGLATLAVTRGRHNARFGAYGFAQRDNSFFQILNTDGTVSPPSQRQEPSGSLFSAFAEDQFRFADWLTVNGGIRYTHFSGGVSEEKASPRAGAALTIPHLHWVFRASYSRYYQAPPLTTISGTLLENTELDFLPLNGETDEQREFGLAIPVHGWTLDIANFQTHARNFFDHDALGNSNIFLPLTIERARIHGWEFTARSPRIRNRARFYFTYSHQTVEGAGGVTGGLTDFEAPDPGFFLLDHDQRDTLSTGFHVQVPWSLSVSGNIGYGSGFLAGDGPDHLAGHTEFSFSLSKLFGERFSVGLTAQNLGDSRYMLDSSNTFGGTHWNYPRQITGQLRYRFHY